MKVRFGARIGRAGRPLIGRSWLGSILGNDTEPQIAPMGTLQLGSSNWIVLLLLMSRSALRTATSTISVQMCASKGECCKVLWVLDRPEIRCANVCLTFTKHSHANNVNSSMLYHSGWLRVFEGQGRKRLKRHKLYAVGHQHAEGHPRVHIIMFYLRHHRAESKREVCLCLWSNLMHMQKKMPLLHLCLKLPRAPKGINRISIQMCKYAFLL